MAPSRPFACALAALVAALVAALASCGSEAEPTPAARAEVARGPTPEQRFFEWTSLQFEASEHARRRAAFAARLRDSGGGVCLTPSLAGRSHGGTFRQLDDFLYLTGLELPESVLAVDADAGRAILFAPRRDARFESASRPNDFPGRPLADDARIARVAGIADLRPIEELDMALREWVAVGRPIRLDTSQLAPAPERIEAVFLGRDPRTSLVEYVRGQHAGARVQDSHEALARVRMVKSAAELERVRRACEITCAGIRAAAAHVRDGVDERTLEAELEAEFKRGGAQRLAFDSIIKSGPNSLWPWRVLAAQYDRRNRVMSAGELVIFDVGCEYDHYASDVGRTFPVSGRFEPEQRRRLEMATAVAAAVIAAVRPGVTFAELKEVALAHIPADERAYMQTGLFFGHHVGLDVGDPSVADAELEAGMTFTVEPWYYNHDEGISVFVEDVVLVTETGAENLSRALPRRPEELEAMVGARR